MKTPVTEVRHDWWFAATGIPLIAATLGPLANLMTITALVMPWKSSLQENSTEGPDLPPGNDLSGPTWCIALSATSLACGVIGSLSLLCRITGAIWYSISLAFVLFCWLLAAASLSASIIWIHIHRRPIQGNQIYSQSYWAALIGAVLYAFLSTMVGANILGCRLGHYPKNGAFTPKQRILILHTFILVIWLAIGGLVFSRSIGISYADALYFSTVTILTIGFGDITNPSSLGRGLIFPYTVIGIVVLGLVVSGFYENAKELHNTEVVRKHTEQQRQKAADCLRSSADDLHRCPRPPLRERTASVPSFGSNLGLHSDDERRFDAIRSIQNEAASFRRTTSLIISIMLFVAIWIIGAIVFWSLEDNITYFNSLYFGFCCLLTIGYGDIAPASNAGRQFFIIWSLISVPIMTTLITHISGPALRVYANVACVIAKWVSLARSHRTAIFIRQTLTHLRDWFRKSGLKSEMSQPDELPYDDHDLSVEESGCGPEQSEPAFARQLALAIQKTVKDVAMCQPKQYSYDEWAKFRSLICYTSLGNKNALSTDRPQPIDLEWDWIGEHSPILSEKTEPQWVLDQLCESLLLYAASHR
ncbi:hypothetical protein BDW72DRAFT_209515 [Aspergillus terricola var. indicus]